MSMVRTVVMGLEVRLVEDLTKAFLWVVTAGLEITDSFLMT